MTVTIFVGTGEQITVEGDSAQEVLLMLELPMSSRWLKIKTSYGMEWLDRAKIVRLKIFG